MSTGPVPAPSRSGRLITFEGIDGAGKSSHVEPLATALRSRGHEVVVTREPGGPALAETLRGLLLTEPMAAETELLLAFAARAEHIRRTIEPALAAGRWVICDRFTDSSFAYQGAGRGLDWALLGLLEGFVRAPEPDLTLLFDLPAAEAAARRASARAADRFESEDQAFFERVRSGYLRRAADQPGRFRIIDASRTMADIATDIEQWAATL